MTLLREYLVEGKSVRDLAAGLGVTELRVRAMLAVEGICIRPGEQRDAVCAAAGWLGFGSFSEFIQRRGGDTLRCQAKALGVTVSALQRVHDVFRKLAVAEAESHDDSDAESQRS